MENIVTKIQTGAGFPLCSILKKFTQVVPIPLGIEVVGVELVPASEGVDLLLSIQFPEWSPKNSKIVKLEHVFSHLHFAFLVRNKECNAFFSQNYFSTIAVFLPTSAPVGKSSAS